MPEWFTAKADAYYRVATASGKTESLAGYALVLPPVELGSLAEKIEVAPATK